MSLTKVLLQTSCSSAGVSSDQPQHMVSNPDGVAAIGHIYPAPQRSGSHQSWSNGDVAERKSGSYLASRQELRESVLNGEPLSQPVIRAPGQARPTSSLVKSSGENEQDFVSDITSDTQSFELRTLTKSKDGNFELANAKSGVGQDIANDPPTLGENASQPDPPGVAPPLGAAAPPPGSSGKWSLGQRLTGVWGGFRPVQIACGQPVTQRPFRTSEVRLLKKDRYEAYKEALCTSLEAKWHDSIHPKLRKNVEAVIQGIGLQPKEMALNVGLSMVGPKVGDILHLLPTIVISCAHKRAKTKIQQLFDSGQLDYIRDFACPYLVCLQGREPERRDRFFVDTKSDEEVDSFAVASPYDLSIQKQESLEFAVEQFTRLRTPCGLKIQFMYAVQDEHYDDKLRNGKLEHEHRMLARIGGVIHVAKEAFVMTTAHTFLFHAPDEESDTGNDSDSTTEEDLETEFAGQSGNDAADYAANHDEKAIRTKATVWMEKGSLYGSYAFCDHGRRFDSPDFVLLTSPNADWCTLSMDSINGMTNRYRAENEKGEAVEVIVDEMAPEEVAEAGNVHILESPEMPMLAYMSQTMVSVYFGGKSLNVRRLISQRPLPAGLSGCWVIRGKQLLGHIIGGNEFEKTMYMVGIQDTKRAIEELTGGDMSLEPTNGMEPSMEEPYAEHLEPRVQDLEDLLARATEVLDHTENTGQSDSVPARYRTISETSRVSRTISREDAEQTIRRWMMAKSADTHRTRRLRNSSSGPLIPTAPLASSFHTLAIKLGASGAVGFTVPSQVPRMLSTRPVEYQGLVRHSHVAGDRIELEIELALTQTIQSLLFHRASIPTMWPRMVGEQSLGQPPQSATSTTQLQKIVRLPQEQAPRLTIYAALKLLERMEDDYLRRQLLTNLNEPAHLFAALKVLQSTKDYYLRRQPLTTLKDPDHLSLIDDAASMQSHWNYVSLALFFNIVNEADHDGVDLGATLSSDSKSEKTFTKLMRHLDGRSPTEASDIDLSVYRILTLYLKRELQHYAQQRRHGTPSTKSQPVRPLFVYVFTDKEWRPDSDGIRSINTFVEGLRNLGISVI